MPLLDVILGYDCNVACDYCTISPEMRTRSMPTPAVLKALREGRAGGFDAVSFTGGEPTIRGDVLGLIKAAKALGFSSIKVQSNGLLLSVPQNLDRLIEAGMTRLHVSVHTHDETAYETMVRRGGTWSHMRDALALAVTRPIEVVADLIITSDTYARLPEAVKWVGALGVREVHLWYVSLTDGNRENVASLPAMREVMPSMHEAIAVGEALGIEVRSLHVPRCLLGPWVSHAYDPGADRVRVVSPDAIFDLKDSRLAGRQHAPQCEGCVHRAVCPGIREDYLERFGVGEFVAVTG